MNENALQMYLQILSWYLRKDYKLNINEINEKIKKHLNDEYKHFKDEQILFNPEQHKRLQDARKDVVDFLIKNNNII